VILTGNFCVATLGCMGRKLKNREEVKTFMLRVRMTEEEHELLEEAAKVKSLQLSSWVRSEMVALARSMLADKSYQSE